MPVKMKQQETIQAASKPAATILLPLPPDYSCEIEKPLRYVDHIANVIGNLPLNKNVGVVTISVEEVETFCWMLRDAGTVIHNMRRDFYGDESWSKVWWKNRTELESCGIRLPYWFEIENSMNAEQQGQL